MAVAIRLARHGAKKRPYYWIVAADKRAPRDGRFLEKLGTYNPLLPKDHENRVTLNEERIRYWLSVGAQPTDRVSRFLEARGILPERARHNPKKGQPGAKALERMKEKAEAKAAAENTEGAVGEENADQPAEG